MLLRAIVGKSGKMACVCMRAQNESILKKMKTICAQFWQGSRFRREKLFWNWYVFAVQKSRMYFAYHISTRMLNWYVLRVCRYIPDATMCCLSTLYILIFVTKCIFYCSAKYYVQSVLLRLATSASHILYPYAYPRFIELTLSQFCS